MFEKRRYNQTIKLFLCTSINISRNVQNDVIIIMVSMVQIGQPQISIIHEMKGLLIFLAIVAACTACKSCHREEPVAPTADKLVELVRGLLAGINEKGDINKLMSCIKGGEDIFAKIKSALEHFKKKDIKHLTKGLEILFDAMRELLNMLKPCMDGFNQLKRLLNALANPNIKKIALRILTHPGEFFVDAAKALTCFLSGNFYCVGKSIGDMLRFIFLSRETSFEPLKDFLKGFLEGIHETKPINDLMKCMDVAERLMEKIKAALELIHKLTIDSMLEGLSMLFEALFELEEMLRPCLEEYGQFKKLMDAMGNANIGKVITKILMNPIQFMVDVMECIKSFEHKKFSPAGKHLGNILYKLFLTQLTLEVDPVEFLKGLLEGLNEKGDVNKLLKCVKDIEKIIDKIIEAIQYIQHMDPTNLIKGITLLLEAVNELMTVITPCAQGFEQIERLIDAIAHVDIVKLVFKILANPGPFVQDVMDCVDAFNKGDFHRAGKDIGDLLYRLFLTEQEVNQQNIPIIILTN
eukprot:TRINITY_DN1899_c0_g1_i1.p2 TRINITY_DN1899_c0_g1~~TRINITY_DN1899_c0_g1_i1.p2  ORF type:complete len:523 (-),score=82.97 TRINITY_DN1899_c0_g1_i1:4803-6371(-)